MFRPDYVGVALESSTSRAARVAVDPDYKGDREPPPATLVAQLAQLPELCRLMGVMSVSFDGLEGDDVIATYARHAEAAGHSVVIASVDKDLAQCVRENVYMWTIGNSKLVDLEEMKSMWGVNSPADVPFVQALMGDRVDNIKGVPGVGPKTAERLVRQFGSLEGLRKGVHEIAGYVFFFFFLSPFHTYR